MHDIQRRGVAAETDAGVALKVAVQFLKKRRRRLQVGALRQVDLGRVMRYAVIKQIEEPAHRVLHAESADQQDHTADNADQRHGKAALVAHEIAQIPLGGEAHFGEKRQFFEDGFLHLLRRVGTQGVRRRTAKLSAH